MDRKRQIALVAALVAVGGFGRAEQYPYSDVDILVLLSEKLSADQLAIATPKVESFITRCWDLGTTTSIPAPSIPPASPARRAMPTASPIAIAVSCARHRSLE